MNADWLRLFRPAQWIKNLFVLGPLLFSGRAFNPQAMSHALAAFLAFCLVSSGVYAINDVMDRDADRVHPVKRERPVAAGAISPKSAAFGGLVLIIAALAVASFV